jgi:hypothetical protein
MFRQESQLPQGKIQAYVGPAASWFSTPQGIGPLAGAQLKQVQGDLFRLYWRLLLSDRIPGRTINAIDDHTVEIADAAGNQVRAGMDPETGLIANVSYEGVPMGGGPISVNVSYEGVPMGGGPISVKEEYEDFRDVNGMKIPFKITIRQGGQKFADVTVNDVKINSGLAPGDLEKRP